MSGWYILGALVIGLAPIVGFFVWRARKWLRRMMRLAKAAATDKRLPRSVRWLFGVSIAVKTLPIPDFGIDEIGLIIGIVLLNTVYRETWAQIRSEIE